MSIIIYKSTNIGENPENGKSYIGFTKQNLNKRKRQHLNAVKNHSKYIFHQAIDRWGFESFSWKIIAIVENSLKETTEVKAIKVYNTLTPNGYNSTTGGEGGFEMIDKIKTKISNSIRGEKHPMFGKHFSQKSKEKMFNAQIGKKNHFYGKKHSIETKKKMSESQRKLNKDIYGEKNPFNKYHYYCSNNKNYWKDFTINERTSICAKFRKENKDIIIYKSIIIIRKLKNERIL